MRLVFYCTKQVNVQYALKNLSTLHVENTTNVEAT
jgi:hypothetical protein